MGLGTLLSPRRPRLPHLRQLLAWRGLLGASALGNRGAVGAHPPSIPHPGLGRLNTELKSTQTTGNSEVARGVRS